MIKRRNACLAVDIPGFQRSRRVLALAPDLPREARERRILHVVARANKNIARRTR